MKTLAKLLGEASGGTPYEVRNEGQAFYSGTMPGATSWTPTDATAKAKEILAGLRKLLPSGDWSVALHPDSNEKIIR